MKSPTRPGTGNTAPDITNWFNIGRNGCRWISCVVRLSSYECGMDQPSHTPVQRIVDASGTLFFKFGDLDATKPSGSVAIRTKAVLHYLAEAGAAPLQSPLMQMKAEVG